MTVSCLSIPPSEASGSKEVADFASVINESHTGYDQVETCYHHSSEYRGGTTYTRTGNTGTPSSGDEYLCYDATGAEFILNKSYVTPAMFGAEYDNPAGNHEFIQAAANTEIPMFLDFMYTTELPVVFPESQRFDVYSTTKYFGLQAVSAMDWMLYSSEQSLNLGSTLKHFTLDCNALADVGLRALEGKEWVVEHIFIFNFNTRGAWFGYPGAPGASFYEMKMEGVKIDAGRGRALASPKTSADYGLYLDAGATDNVIDSLIVSYVQDTGVIVEGGANRFDELHVYGGPRIGMWYDGAVMVTNSYFDTISDYCVFSDVRGGTFTNCLFKSNTGSPFHTGTCYGYGSSGVFSVQIRGGEAADIAAMVDPAVVLFGGASVIEVDDRATTAGLSSGMYYGNYRYQQGGNSDRWLAVQAKNGYEGSLRFEDTNFNTVYKIAKDNTNNATHNCTGLITFETKTKFDAGISFFGSGTVSTAPTVSGDISAGADLTATKAVVASLADALSVLGLINDTTIR